LALLPRTFFRRGLLARGIIIIGATVKLVSSMRGDGGTEEDDEEDDPTPSIMRAVRRFVGATVVALTGRIATADEEELGRLTRGGTGACTDDDEVGRVDPGVMTVSSNVIDGDSSSSAELMLSQASSSLICEWL